MEVEDETDTKMDISSMIDCCFLLLIYFIVATSLVDERKIDMGMPSNQKPATVKSPIQPGLVTIDAKGAVSWGQAGADTMVINTDMEVHDLPELVEALSDFKTRAESLGSEPMVQLNVDGSVPNQRVIDVLNSFTISGIKKVGLTQAADE